MLMFSFSKMFQKTLKYLSLVILLVLVGTIPRLVSNYSQYQKNSREKEAISNRVLSIMKTYNCENPEIYEAIMATFDPVLVAVVIAVESEYRVDAISRAGCRGLMQLSPDKLENWKDIGQNIHIGAAYLEKQINRFGDLELAFAAYNAGPESVKKYQGVPPYKETIAYIKKAKSFGIDNVKPNQMSKAIDQKRYKTIM